MTQPHNFLDDDVSLEPIRVSTVHRRESTVSRQTLIWLLILTALVSGIIGYCIGRAVRPAETPAPTVAAPPPVPSTTSAAPPAPVATPSLAPSPAPTSDGISHVALLETLEIKGRAPMTGYDRELYFGQAWLDVDGNGCRTREDILRRDLTDVVIKPDTGGCVVASGTLVDPYTGATIQFVRGQGTSELVQIDHVVALADAWQKGAQQWSQEKREAFANDPLNLLAVDGAANQQKGAGDAATWLPPNRAYWCEYAQRIVEVKASYGIWTTEAEHQRLGELLNRC